MASNVAEIRIEPCKVNWEIEEQWQVTCVADDAGSLNETFFLMYLPDGTFKHVWFDVASGGTDPAPGGSAGGIEVNVATNALASAVATAVQAAVDADAGWVATVDGTKVLITNADVGQVNSMVDGADPTGFVFTQCQDGGALDMGFIDGDIEVSFEESQLDITAHQTGTTILASLRQGLINNVTMTMKEADYEKYKELMLGTAGGAFTPSGGTEVFGWGTQSLGQNTIIKSRRLVLHPVALASSDKSRDLCFWKAYALPETLTISGENPKTLGLSFKVYRDDNKPAAVNQFIFGDWSQAGIEA
jgi:hypothetical protein